WYLAHGLNIRPLGSTVYLMPPYCITDEELGRAYAGLIEGLEATRSHSATATINNVPGDAAAGPRIARANGAAELARRQFRVTLARRGAADALHAAQEGKFRCIDDAALLGDDAGKRRTGDYAVRESFRI